MDWEYLLNNLDKIIIYFIPASSFMIAYGLIAHYTKEFKIFSAEIIVISYIIAHVLQFLIPSITTFGIVIIAFILGILAGLIKNSEKYETFYKKYFHKVYNDNVWYGISDFKHGCYIQTFLENSDISYRGSFRDDYKDSNGTIWIVISNYMMYRGYDTDKCKIIEDYSGDDTRRIVLDTSKISRVSVHYSSKSVKIK